MKKTLEQLQSENLPRLDWHQLLSLDRGPLDPDMNSELTEYFRRFLPPADCVCCGKKLIGTLVDIALGLTTFEWGLVHGEGHCRHCRYPARAYHRDVGPIKFLNCVLQYHPDELEVQIPPRKEG